MFTSVTCILIVSDSFPLVHIFATRLRFTILPFPIEYENKNEWISAVDEELSLIKKNQVWTLIDRPKLGKTGKRSNIIDSKWVFKRKNDCSGQTKFKARLVIRGFKDRNSYDLKETYAPVSRLTLVRTVLALINYYDLDVCQLAFLNGIIISPKC